MNQHHPHHPIIYVRGFAATQGEIEETCADPYMGFNLGSTKSRQIYDGKLKKFFFESPMVRLQTDYDYKDVYFEGEDIVASDRTDVPVPYKSVIIYRYYDEASEDFGSGETPPIEHFGRGLAKLILRLRDKYLSKPHPDDEKIHGKIARDNFRVYLVAHSMGGLVSRCFLQIPQCQAGRPPIPNEEYAQIEQARKMVDKVFTYATPHNGIDMRIVSNVPAWASFGDVNNFNRKRMASYLDLPIPTDKDEADVSELRNIHPDRVFNLVGTNPNDYLVMKGLSSWAAGDASDGLVRIANATTFGKIGNQIVHSPRAFVHRSHSGHYGIVNSEEGYQNLTRFLFGNIRVDGVLDIDEVILPEEVETKLAELPVAERERFKASYQFEIAVSVRGHQWQIHRRSVRENSAIFRKYDDLFPVNSGKRVVDRSQSPHLFSLFLDGSKSTRKDGSVSFAFDIAVLVPDYTIKGKLIFDSHYEGGYIYRDQIIVEAKPDHQALGGWKTFYGYQSETPNRAPNEAKTEAAAGGDGILFSIEVDHKMKPGIDATLRIHARNWNV